MFFAFLSHLRFRGRNNLNFLFLLGRLGFLWLVTVCSLHLCSGDDVSCWAEILDDCLVFCMTIVMNPVSIVCLGCRSLWNCPCVGCYGTIVETLSILNFDLFNLIALRGNGTSLNMQPMSRRWPWAASFFECKVICIY